MYTHTHAHTHTHTHTHTHIRTHTIMCMAGTDHTGNVPVTDNNYQNHNSHKEDLLKSNLCTQILYKNNLLL